MKLRRVKRELAAVRGEEEVEDKQGALAAVRAEGGVEDEQGEQGEQRESDVEIFGGARYPRANRPHVAEAQPKPQPGDMQPFLSRVRSSLL